jgi:hypothetical protein
MTRGSKVVVNSVLVGVGWIIEGLRVGVKAYVFTISPKVPLLSHLLVFPIACSGSGEERDQGISLRRDTLLPQ